MIIRNWMGGIGVRSYERPELLIERFPDVDIITTSLDVGEDGDTGFGELQ